MVLLLKDLKVLGRRDRITKFIDDKYEMIGSIINELPIQQVYELYVNSLCNDKIYEIIKSKNKNIKFVNYMVDRIKLFNVKYQFMDTNNFINVIKDLEYATSEIKQELGEKIFKENIYKDIFSFNGLVLTGKQFNEITKVEKFYKAIHPNMTHYGYKYTEGLNIDYIKFATYCECCAGGLYFTNIYYIDDYCLYNDKLYEVEVPDDALVYIEKNKIKSTKLIIKSMEQKYDILKTIEYVKTC